MEPKWNKSVMALVIGIVCGIITGVFIHSLHDCLVIDLFR